VRAADSHVPLVVTDLHLPLQDPTVDAHAIRETKLVLIRVEGMVDLGQVDEGGTDLDTPLGGLRRVVSRDNGEKFISILQPRSPDVVLIWQRDASVTHDRPKDVLLILQPRRPRKPLVTQHRIKVNGMIITHPDQPLKDLAVPFRVALVTTRDELDRRVDQTQRVGPPGGLLGVVCGGEVADLPRSVHCRENSQCQRNYA
jgi:hypothetical protein